MKNGCKPSRNLPLPTPIYIYIYIHLPGWGVQYLYVLAEELELLLWWQEIRHGLI